MAVPSAISYPSRRLAVPLPRYAQIVSYSEAAFFGVSAPYNEPYICRAIWTSLQRKDIARELLAAQEQIEQHVGYYLVPTYTEGERHELRTPVVTNMGRLIALGRRAVSGIALGVSVSHAADPVTVTLPGVTIGNTSEVRVYHFGTDIDIIPSGVTYAGGTLTIKIPRVRMVRPENEDNPPEGWDYDDVSLFADKIDIKREYTDTTAPVHYVAYRLQSGQPPAEIVKDGSGVIRNAAAGIVELLPLDVFCLQPRPALVGLDYLSGLLSVSEHLEDIVIRYAHSRLPDAPCGCDFLRAMWERDRNIPQVLTAERENCPWGMSDGAWTAWTFARSAVQYRARALFGGV